MRDKYCYFCDFNEIKPHRHHIIRKAIGGKNEDNLLSVCPNHHALIHQSDYVLSFNKGKYFLINNKKNLVINPSEKNKNIKYKIPKSSLLNNPKIFLSMDQGGFIIFVEGDFNKVGFEDFENIGKTICP